MTYRITYDRINWTATDGPKNMTGTYEQFLQEANDLAEIHGHGPTWVESAIDETGKECNREFWEKSDYGFKLPEDFEF
jgi:hypothetical protein